MGKLIGGIVLSILGVVGLAVPSAFAPPAMLRSPDVQMGVMVYTVAGGFFDYRNCTYNHTFYVNVALRARCRERCFSQQPCAELRAISTV